MNAFLLYLVLAQFPGTAPVFPNAELKHSAGSQLHLLDNVKLSAGNTESDPDVWFDNNGSAFCLTTTSNDGGGGTDGDLFCYTLTGNDLLWSAIMTITNTGLHLLDTGGDHDLIIAPGTDVGADRTLTLTTGDSDRTLTFEANATISQDYSTDGSVQFGDLTVNNTGLHVLDSNASHDLVLKPGSDLSADRELTLTTGDAARTVTIEGDSTIDQDYSSDAKPSFAGITSTAEADFTNNAAAATFGAVLTDADVVLAFDAVTNQGELKYWEDEDRFSVDNDLDVIADLTAGTVTSDAAVTATTNVVAGATGLIEWATRLAHWWRC
jgi:hypothetical protein